MMTAVRINAARAGPSQEAPSQMRLGSVGGWAGAAGVPAPCRRLAPVGTAPLIAVSSVACVAGDRPAPEPPPAPAAAAKSLGGVVLALRAAWLAAACRAAAPNPGSRCAGEPNARAGAPKSPPSCASKPRLVSKNALMFRLGRALIA